MDDETVHRDVQIHYNSETYWQARGRNNYLKCCGLALSPFLLASDRPEIWLNPITSRGQVSENCRIVVPAEALPELIDALTAWRDRHCHVRAKEE